MGNGHIYYVVGSTQHTMSNAKKIIIIDKDIADNDG